MLQRRALTDMKPVIGQRKGGTRVTLTGTFPSHVEVSVESKIGDRIAVKPDR